MSATILRFTKLVTTKDIPQYGLVIPEVVEAESALVAQLASEIRTRCRRSRVSPQDYASLRSDAYANAQFKWEIPVDGEKYVLCSLAYKLELPV